MSAAVLLDSWLRERLFDLVPSAIAVIDADWQVVRANLAFEERFGEWRGRRCFEVYKGRKRRCGRCPAARTFSDGRVRTRHEVGVDREGRPAHYVVHIVPLSRGDGTIPLLVEMSTDVTRQSELKDELERANTLNRTLVEASGDAIVALDTRGRVTLWNPAATALFGLEPGATVHRAAPASIFPPGFEEAALRGEPLALAETEVDCGSGGRVPVRFYGVGLSSGGTHLGRAAFYQDLREVKQLEREKLDAERLAAVGQTVSGLAHAVKNILTGLEGGLYLMQTGLDKGLDTRVRDGFAMLARNLGRITGFVRTLLDFSRGHAPRAQLVNPVALAEEVAGLFRETAAQAGVELVVEAERAVGLAALDPEGLHTCLANLVTNALDACRMSESTARQVTVRVLEEAETPTGRLPPDPRGTLVFEVLDNGEGMECEVKRKVFTNFFTTKGSKGTGLGLLATRKIVHEHGGHLDVESTPGQGSVFRLVFPIRRLPKPAQAQPASGPEPGPGRAGPGSKEPHGP